MSRNDDPEAQARAERLAAALRANLKRRKQQAKGRHSAAPEPDAAAALPEVPSDRRNSGTRD